MILSGRRQLLDADRFVACSAGGRVVAVKPLQCRAQLVDQAADDGRSGAGIRWKHHRRDQGVDQVAAKELRLADADRGEWLLCWVTGLVVVVVGRGARVFGGGAEATAAVARAGCGSTISRCPVAIGSRALRSALKLARVGERAHRHDFDLPRPARSRGRLPAAGWPLRPRSARGRGASWRWSLRDPRLTGRRGRSCRGPPCTPAAKPAVRGRSDEGATSRPGFE